MSLLNRPLWSLARTLASPARDLRRMRCVVDLPETGDARGTPGMNLGVCAIMKNEGDYIAEWLAFHQAVGVDHVFLYDNDSAEAQLAPLEPFERSGFVTVTRWPAFLSDGNPQYLAYAHALQLARGRCRWLAPIDVDEFLFSPAGHSLPDVLRKLEAHAAVGVFRHEYGTCGHTHRPGGLVIENYLRRAPSASRSRAKFKSIVRPEAVRSVHSAHRFGLAPGLRYVDETGAPIVKGWDGLRSERAEQLCLNHYTTRSAAEFEAKLARGRMVKRPDWPDKARAQAAALDRQATTTDTAILRWAEAVRTRLQALAEARPRSNPQVRESAERSTPAVPTTD